MVVRYFVGPSQLVHLGKVYAPGSELAEAADWSRDVREDNLRAGTIIEVESKEDTKVIAAPQRPQGGNKKRG